MRPSLLVSHLQTLTKSKRHRGGNGLTRAEAVRFFLHIYVSVALKEWCDVHSVVDFTAKLKREVYEPEGSRQALGLDYI